MLICHKCKSEFTKQQRLDRHLNDRKFPCDAYICKICGDKLPNRKLFTKHVKNNNCDKPEDIQSSIANFNHEPVSTFLNNKEYFMMQLEQTKAAAELAKAETEKLKVELEKAKFHAENERAKAEAMIIFKKPEFEQSTIDHTVNQSNALANINGDNNTVVIQLINFGNENLSGLSTGVLNQISSDPLNQIPNLAVKKIYFNPKCPENQIIKPCEYTTGKVKYYNNNNWEIVKRDIFAKTLLEKTSEAINRRCNQMPLSKERVKLKEFINTKCLNESDEKEEMEITLDCEMTDYYNALLKSKNKVTFE